MLTSTSGTMSRPCRFVQKFRTIHWCSNAVKRNGPNSSQDCALSRDVWNLPSQYHKHDLTLARTMGDRLGEAKASGNLGNTLKVMKNSYPDPVSKWWFHQTGAWSYRYAWPLIVMHIMPYPLDIQGIGKMLITFWPIVQVMGKFEEAVICCRRHLEICRWAAK